MSAPRPRQLAVLGALLMATGLLLGAFALPSDADTGDDPAAAKAIRALVSGDVERSRAAMPADFAARVGYRPVLRDGLLVRPDGSCSSPLPLPDRFETVCARHDLGYDLLRYAAAHHRPLGQWARVRVDDALAAGLRDTCGDVGGAGCRLAARTAYLAVRANSRRQGDGVPGPESVASVGAVVFGGSGLLSLLVLPVPPLTRRLNRLLRRNPTRAPALRLPAAPVLLVGGLATSASLVPSVLARPAWLQGLFTGLLVAVTYPVGRWLARFTRDGLLDRSRARQASVFVAVTASVVSATWPVAAGQTLLDPARSPGPAAGWLVAGTVATGVCAVLLLLGSLAVLTARGWRRRLAPARPVLGRLAVGGVPARQRWHAGTLILLGLLLATGDPVTAAARAGLTSDPGARFFEAVGLDTADENVLSRPSARGAVRVYVGREAATGPAARGREAVRRLERVRGFDRANLVLAFPTGSGWVDPVGVRAIERRFGGDVATVAVQSTFLPSWAALLVAREDNEHGARELVAAVTERLARMPAADRPRLYLIGQSLGVLAATGVPADSPGATMVCGAGWTGPPGGEVPRLPNPVVLANPDDPVVIWEPSMVWHRPASYPAEVWLPGVSWLATGLDTIGSLGAAPGHGHRYGPQQGLLLPDCSQQPAPDLISRAGL